MSDALDKLGSALSGLTHGASLVLTPKYEEPIKHIEFVSSHQSAFWLFWFLQMVR